MAQLFLGKSAPTCQSTPKPGHQLPLTAVKDPVKVHEAMDRNTAGDHSLSFVTLNDAQRQHRSVDPGDNLEISSIGERVEWHRDTGVSAESSGETVSDSTEDIQKQAQDLIESINQSRIVDQEIMTSFEETLLRKVNEACQQLKEQMFVSYEEQGRAMEACLQELSEVLERCSQLSSELQGANQTLSGLLLLPGP